MDSFPKNRGNGLLAVMSAKAFINMNQQLDPDIKTIYLNEIEMLSLEELRIFVGKVKSNYNNVITIIIAMETSGINGYTALPYLEFIRVDLPILVERKEDIRPLVTHFLTAFHSEFGTSAIKIKEDAWQVLESYSWPGNVEELYILIHDAVKEEKGFVIGKGLIQQLLGERLNKMETMDNKYLQGTLEEIEKELLTPSWKKNIIIKQKLLKDSGLIEQLCGEN